MTEQVARLKKKRGTLRTAVTKSLTDLETETLKEEPTKIVDLEELLEIVLNNFESLKATDDQLEPFLKIEEFDAEFSKAEEYRQKVVRAKFRATKRIEELKRDSLTLSVQVNSTPTESRSGPKSNDIRINLPKLCLQTFSGEYDKWLTFWNSFESAIHKNNSLDKIDKFNYLKAHLVGSALSTIEGLPISESNYDSAIDLLKTRFAKTDLLIHTHMNNILTVRPLRNSQDVRAFRKFYDKILVELRSLENLGESLENLSSVLCTTIFKALPQDILIEINKKNNAKVYSSVKELMSVIEQSLESRERAETIIQHSQQKPQCFPPVASVSNWRRDSTTIKQNKKENKLSSAAELVSTDVKIKAIETCVFCEASHNSNFCPLAKKMTNEEKVNILRRKGICFACLKRKGHLSRNCTEKIICPRCGFKHAEIMCNRFKSQNEKGNANTVKESENLSNQSNSSEVYLQTLIVGVTEKGSKYHFRLLIDSGSQNSYVSQYAAKVLKLDSLKTEQIKHGLFGGGEIIEHHNRYRLNLTSLDGKYNCQIEVLDQEKICSSVPRVKNKALIKLLNSKGLCISDTCAKGDVCLYEQNPEEIHILLGADVSAQLFTDKMEHFPGFGITAFKTKLGWTLMGRMEENTSLQNSLSGLSLSLHVSDAKLSDLWRLDVLGIASDDNKTKGVLEEETQKHFLETVKQDSDGRYEVTLPWIMNNAILPTNRSIAEKSLNRTESKLTNINKRKEYQEIFDYWEDNEIIEVMSERKERVHFLPHRPVIKESSETTKIRPVFNASAHSRNSPSLNDCLAKGPNLIEIIPSILNRFRKYRIGISSDIEKAFCQIKIAEKDRDFLRFLWFDSQNNLKIYRHNRVVFGLTSSPFLLAATLNHLLNTVKENFEDTAQILRDSFYIDNSLVSLSDIEETGKFIDEAKMILASGRFNLRCWRSNIPIEVIGETENTQKEVPVLGLVWDIEKDSLRCKIEEIGELKEQLTKRKILSTTQKIFDPVGFTTPATLIPKLILQESWVQKIKWDQEVPSPLREQFDTWLKQLPLITQIEIPRWLNIDYENEEKIALHIFADASKRAYATCVYLRIETLEGTKVQLVNARSRVAPIKELTIPRLELLSCLIGARLAKTVISDMKLENCSTVFWSDSSTALGWIRRDQAWGTFVHNRVQEIRSLTKISNWRHVPGTLNPADLPSRGCSFEHLQKSRWWEGPSWLHLPENEWPQTEEQPDEELLNQEKRKTILTLIDNPKESFEWYYRYFSSYRKIVRMIAWIFRFFRNSRSNEKNLSGNISVDEFGNAEKVIYKLIQKEAFTGITDPSIRALRPVEDEHGIFRAKTNVVYRIDERNFRYPVILPSNHPVVEKLIWEKHLENQHAGVSVLMAQLRENFWILKSRKSIRNVIRKCVRCKRFSTQRIDVEPGIPPMDRVREAAIFEIVGVDLAGPLYLSDGSKSWIVLYTCAIYRAIHLELVTSLSTETYIQSLRRFIARRGRPHIIYSDNGTNFLGTDRSLKAIDWNSIEAAAACQRIRWKFNPPTAAWWGGWWERIVRMIKEILRKVLGRASLNYEEMTTVLCDCEQVVNSRPLTYVAEDGQDPAPLTPLMFMQELSSSGVPDLDLVDSSKLSRRAKYRQRIRSALRNRFRNEYLGQLRQQALKKNMFKQLKIGEVVLLEEMNKKRIHWPLAKVVEIFPGKDNTVRLAKVKTENGLFLRPVARLFPLEICAADSRDPENQHQKACVPPVTDSAKNDKDSRKRTSELSPTSPIATRAGRIVKPPQRLDL